MMIAPKPTEALLHLALLALLGSVASGDASYSLLTPLAILVVLAIASEQLHWRWVRGVEGLLRRTHSPGICHGLVALPMLLQAVLAAQGNTGGKQHTRLLLRACTFSSFALLLALCLFELLAPLPRRAPSSRQQPQPAAEAKDSLNSSSPGSSDSSSRGTRGSSARPTCRVPPPAGFRRLPIHPALLIATATIPCLLALCCLPYTTHTAPNNLAQPQPMGHTTGMGSRTRTRAMPALLGFTALHHALLAALLHHLPCSFTLCEATLVAQAAACTAAHLIRTCVAHPALLRHLLLDHWSTPPRPNQPPSAHPALIPAFTILLCSLVLLACSSVAVLVQQARAPKGHPKHLTPQPTRQAFPRGPAGGLLAALAGIALVAACVAMASLAAWVLRWLAEGPAARRRLLQYWVAVLAGGLPLMVALLRSGRCPHIIVRKGYHLLAVALFLPAAVLDLPMLAVSLAIAFALLAALEALRAAQAGPLARAIDGFMSGFTDTRDTGPLYLTHFTLLLGMATPVWLAAGLWPEARPPAAPTAAHAAPLAAALSGVMCLGLGDTAASAVGFLWGRHTMFAGSSKTWEGTLAGCAATLAGWLALAAAEVLVLPGRAWAGVVACSAAASLLEAATVQLDNLFVPVYYLAAVLAALAAST